MSTTSSVVGSVRREPMRIAGDKVYSDRVIEVRYPWTGEVVATVPKASVDDVKRAFKIARDYKPQPIVYLASASALGCLPEETMMVAAHSDDLQAAARAGLKTAFIARPDEHGPGLGESQPKIAVDFSARDLVDLAKQLGCH